MTSQRNFRGYSEEGAGKRTWLSQDLLKLSVNIASEWEIFQ